MGQGISYYLSGAKPLSGPKMNQFTVSKSQKIPPILPKFHHVKLKSFLSILFIIHWPSHTIRLGNDSGDGHQREGALFCLEIKSWNNTGNLDLFSITFIKHYYKTSLETNLHIQAKSIKRKILRSTGIHFMVQSGVIYWKYSKIDFVNNLI